MTKNQEKSTYTSVLAESKHLQPADAFHGLSIRQTAFATRATLRTPQSSPSPLAIFQGQLCDEGEQ